MKRTFVSALACVVTLVAFVRVASAQPVSISWRPPVGCSASQAIIWSGSAWTCGSSGFGTAGTGLTSSGTTVNVIGTTGGGLTVAADSVGLLTTCGSGEILKWSGAAWACAADDTIGSGAITGTGTANAISKWTSTSIQGDSLLTDNTTTLAYATNKFTVLAASGNTTVAGTLAATGAITDGGARVFSAAGTGLTSAAATVTLALATQDCAAGSFFDSNTATGAFTCVAEVGDITEVVAGSGLTGTATSGPVTVNVIGSSDFDVTADLLDLSTAVTAPGTLSTAGHFTSGDDAADVLDHNGTISKFGSSVDGAVYFENDEINFGHATNATATGYINTSGYLAGITQFRDLVLGDGKGATACTLTGSTKTLNCVGSITVNGTAVNTFTTNNTLPKGNGTALVASSITDDGTTAAVGSVLDVNNRLSKFGSTSDGYTYIDQDTIGFGYAENAAYTGYVNFRGYQNGATQFRNLIVADGKGASVATFTGSDKSLAVVGNLSTAANLTAGDADADTHTLRGVPTVKKAGADSAADLYFENDVKNWRIGVDGSTSDSFHITETAVAVWTRWYAGGELEHIGHTQLGDASTDRVGIGVAPGTQSAMTFSGAVGGKIDLLNVDATTAYGLGVQSNQQQYFVPSSSQYHSFGFGDSDAFTEAHRLEADGDAIIGNSSGDLITLNGITAVQNFRGTIETLTSGATLTDYALGATTTTLIISSSAGLTLNGFTGGVNGRELTIIVSNATSHDVTWIHDATSTAANRIYLPMHSNWVTASTNVSAKCIYDGAISRWRCTILGSTSLPSLAVSGAASFNGTVTLGNDNLDSATITGHFATAGTVPTLSSCGTTPTLGTGANDNAGSFTTGTGGTTCTITFSRTRTNEPACIIQTRGSATMPTCTVSATAITCTTTIAATKYHYQCMGV